LRSTIPIVIGRATSAVLKRAKKTGNRGAKIPNEFF
jgi:hypothetical protein